MTSPQLDLQKLRLDRPSAMPVKRTRRRPWISRYAVPAAIVLGFAALLVMAMGERLLPRRPVSVVPVILARAEVRREGTPLFQAAGWVEPRPTPISVPALTAGVVEELLVVEGQEVQQNAPVARLIDVDAELALREAETAVELEEAELQSAEADVKAARLRKENPVHLESALADAESMLAETRTAFAQIPYLTKASQARLDYAKQNLEGKEAAEKAIRGRLVQEARREFIKAEAEHEELLRRSERVEAELRAKQKKVNALSTGLDLLIEESRQLEEAESRRKAARARLARAKLSVEKAKLASERTVVRAPIAGRVLSLVAYPGSRVMGLEATAGQSSSTVVTLFDPAMLQVRADVRLEDVPLVRPGQAVRIETASAKKPISGTVLAATSSADIQKNTLEVKVALDDPPPAIRPEMLVTATFLAPPSTNSHEAESEEYERLLIPRKLVLPNDTGASVWIVDPDETAQRRKIEIGKAGTDDLVEVTDGLRATDKLISSGYQGLEPGTRVTITGEDGASNLGATGSSQRE